jgi:uncharacterized protein YlxP (DUF503 family)
LLGPIEIESHLHSQLDLVDENPPIETESHSQLNFENEIQSQLDFEIQSQLNLVDENPPIENLGSFYTFLHFQIWFVFPSERT